MQCPAVKGCLALPCPHNIWGEQLERCAAARDTQLPEYLLLPFLGKKMQIFFLTLLPLSSFAACSTQLTQEKIPGTASHRPERAVRNPVAVPLQGTVRGVTSCGELEEMQTIRAAAGACSEPGTCWGLGKLSSRTAVHWGE